MSHRRKFAVLTASLLSALGLVVAPIPATAAPAANCRATSCDGVDPELAGCSADARTIDELHGSGYHLHLRYSPACHAAWVRVDSDGYWSQNGTMRIERQSPSSYWLVTFGPGQTGRKWTDMYSFTYFVRGRLMVHNTGSGWRSDDVTPWH
jgi:hypothetical protein